MAMHGIQICKRTTYFQKGKLGQAKKNTSKNIRQALEVFHSYVYAVMYIFLFLCIPLRHSKALKKEILKKTEKKRKKKKDKILKKGY